MLNKVIKKLQNTGKLPKKTSSKYNLKQGKPSLRGNSGFIAKKNSSTGAERQRSIGNRNTKPTQATLILDIQAELHC